jgi:hypothetical protein
MKGLEGLGERLGTIQTSPNCTSLDNLLPDFALHELRLSAFPESLRILEKSISQCDMLGEVGQMRRVVPCKLRPN